MCFGREIRKIIFSYTPLSGGLDNTELKKARDQHTNESFSPCHAEYFYVLQCSPILMLLTCSIPVISMYFQSKWKTV